jgi:type IV secretory pathway component VirB8
MKNKRHQADASGFSSNFNSDASSNAHSQSESNYDSGSYFEAAKSWSDDYYALAMASRNRYQMAFFAVLGLMAVLAMSLVYLALKQNIELIVVHQGDSGYEWVSSLKPNEKLPSSWVKTRSELARYLIARESYDPVLYAYQTREVSLMSSSSVFSEYEFSQDSSHPASLVNLLGARGHRTVQVLTVLLLDKIPEQPTPGVHHENLAQVSFMVEDHSLDSNQVIKTPYTAMISWEYLGTPSDPEALFKNWDGFRVIKYVVQPVISG